MLEAFGILFTRDLKIYVYPSKPSMDAEIMTLDDMPVHPRLKPLYDYLISNKRLVDIESYDRTVLHIFSKAVLQLIRDGKPGWEDMVPPYVDNMIKDNALFGYTPPTSAPPPKPADVTEQATKAKA